MASNTYIKPCGHIFIENVSLCVSMAYIRVDPIKQSYDKSIIQKTTSIKDNFVPWDVNVNRHLALYLFAC